MQSILFADTAKHFLEINGIHVHAQTVDTRLSFPSLQQRGYEVTTISHFVVAYLTVGMCEYTCRFQIIHRLHVDVSISFVLLGFLEVRTPL